MASDLPEEFDVIVLGTGLPETLLAAAFSRIGLSVLHLDRNAYYSGSWASFSLKSVSDWIKEQQKADCYVTAVDQEKLSTLVKEGERALELPETFPVVVDPKSEYHVGERPKEPESSKPPDSSSSSPTTVNTNLSDSPSATSTTPTATDAHTGTDSADKPQAANPSDLLDNQTVTEEDSAQHDSASQTASSIVPGQFDSVPEEGEAEQAEGGKGPVALLPKEAVAPQEKTEEKKWREWFAEDVAKQWRKFSFDLAPKLLYCTGSMVELLIVSDVAKYCEFRTVSRVLTMRDNKLEKVPCSRADVFSSKALSLMEKRLLMKFLTFAAQYDQHPEEYKDFSDKPFQELMASKKLSPKVQHFILHSIAMATENTPTQQVLERIQKFLRSLGRYGNTAFLFPLYGSGELPQAFCRLSAVFGGIYVLTLSVSHLLVNDDNKCTGVITSAGQRIGCKYLIADPSYLMKEYYHVPETRHISRGIFVTDKSIFPEEAEDLSLLQFPHEGQPSSPVTTVLELPPSAMVSPRPLYVVHMTRKAESDVQSDLQPALSTLFEDTEAGRQEGRGEDSDKPRVLWSLMYQQKDLSVIAPTDQSPHNVFVVTGPGTELDMDRCVAEVSGRVDGYCVAEVREDGYCVSEVNGRVDGYCVAEVNGRVDGYCVAEARAIFQKLCPEEEFLPKPPHPDDIIYVDTEEVSAAGNEKGEWAAEAVEGAAEAVDGGPEAVDGAPEAVDGAPEAVYGAPEAVDGAPEAVDGAPEAVDGAPEVVDGAASQGQGEGGQREDGEKKEDGQKEDGQQKEGGQKEEDGRKKEGGQKDGIKEGQREEGQKKETDREQKVGEGGEGVKEGREEAGRDEKKGGDENAASRRHDKVKKCEGEPKVES
ncbi:hypothetical protein ACOMHN_032476 [Nucella lapillus]